MPTPTKGPRLGGGPAHERLMLANLATALFEHGRITTTEAKAKRLRPLAERLITFAKRGDLHARRRVLTVVRDKGVVHELFTEIGPRYENRHGGYTRITKVGPRKGDNAPMAVIELVEALTAKAETVRDKDVVYALFSDIAPRYANRPGGYTRIVKTGPRKGDAAPMAIIELVEELAEAAPAKAAKPAKRAQRKAAKADAVAALAPDDEDEVLVPAAQTDDDVDDDAAAAADVADDDSDEDDEDDEDDKKD